jgi:hypothetical protein
MGIYAGARQKGKNWERVTTRVDERAPTAEGGWAWRVQKGIFKNGTIF